jgi:hypothetical protein
MLSLLPGAVAVYRLGNVRSPGISDLDRLVVVEDMRSVPDVWSRATESTRRLAMHSPFLTDISTFRRHRWFADLGQVELVWGQPLHLEQPPWLRGASLLTAVEALVTLHLKLHKIAVTGRVKVRPLLCELNNVGRDLELASLPRSDAEEAWILADNIFELRREWWSLKPPDQRMRFRWVLDLASAAIPSTIEILSDRLGERAVAEVPLSLHSPWSNVSLVPGAANVARARASATLTRLGARPSEARWQWARRRVHVPNAILALLRGSDDRFQPFYNQRRTIVRRYINDAQNARGYSLIGFAGAFVER